MSRPDPYSLLGIGPDATTEEVRAAFRRKVRQNHPDTATTEGESFDVQEIVEAYRLLVDPVTRARSESERGQREGGVTGRRVNVTHRGRGSQPVTGTLPLCSSCGGSGSKTDKVSCPHCHGRAQVTALDRDPARVVPCRRCRGLGVAEVSRRCASCGGSGSAAG